MRVRTLAVTAIVIFLGACTFTMSERLPSRAYRVETVPRCSFTHWAQGVDAAATLSLGYLLARDEMRVGNDLESRRSGAYLRDLALSGGILVAFAGSLVWGLHHSGRCERARNAHDRWLQARRP